MLDKSLNETILSVESTEDDLIPIDKQDKLFLERIARKIHDSGLVTPAVFFLEMTKPLSLLGSHALVFFGPVINAFIQSENYYRSVQVFEEAANIEFLLQMIESMENQVNIENTKLHE
ncbi:MAG: hypothetical protein CMG57_05300 [Candidatus Marinimicrobia bacterium]|nr:hypothetical protein [Candidatus Neomarinimicrobiota bacterium]